MEAPSLLYLLIFSMSNFYGLFCFPHVREYIDNKLLTSGLDLNKSSDIKPSNTSSSLKEVIVFPSYYEEGYITTLFNDTYVILGQEWINVSGNETKSILRTKENITFAKGIEYKNMAFLITCFASNVCDFYTLSTERYLYYTQTISFQNALRHFQHFVFNDKLHFAMDNSIYLWTGTYFDQMYQLPHDGVILRTFPSNLGSQIVISEKFGMSKNLVLVYELVDNEFIKLQSLSNLYNIQGVLNYVYENVQHIMFLKELDAATVYRFIDSELMFLANLNKFSKAKVSYAYINQTTPVFAVTKMDIISLYQLNKRESCLYDIAVVNVSRILDSSITNDFKINILFDSVDGKTVFSSLLLDKDTFEDDNALAETNELFECVNKLEKELRSLKLTKNHTNLRSKQFQTRSLKDNAEFEANPHLTRVFNGKVIIKNNLLAQHLKIKKSLFFKNLNGITWKPETWLSKSKPQTIHGTVVVKALNVQNLDCPNSPLFTDLLFTSSSQSIDSSAFISNDIISNSIQITKLNDIKFEDIYLKNSGKVITGTKQFRNVNTNDSSIGSINKFEAATFLILFGDQKSNRYNFSKNLQVDSLEVKKINGIEFDNLYSSAYKLGTDSIIDGNLRIQSATVFDLVTKNIAGINAKLLLDKVTTQEVNSSVEFRNIDAYNIISKNINGDDVTNFVNVANNATVAIKGNVRINDINILGDLHLNDFMSNMGENERILGTNATDLLQIYNKSVKIRGNVIINNLILQTDVVPIIDSLAFSYDDLENYWLYNKEQTIDKHVIFKSGISAPSINFELLNDVAFSNYVRKDVNIFSNISLNFETLVLNGDMISNNPIGCERLLNESVKITGKYFITGKKIFAGNVGVNKLKTRQINGIDITNLPNLYNFVNSTKKFSTIVFKEHVSSKSLISKFINKKDLAEIWSSALRSNMDLEAEEFVFENVTVVKLNVGELNGIHFNEYILSLDRIYQLKTLENVFVSNAIGRHFHGVETINSLPFEEIINHENYGTPLNGDYYFKSNLFIKDLKVNIVNGIDFGSLTQQLLYRHWSQDISGHFTFNIVQAAHLGTPRINSYNLESLIDVDSEEPQELLAPGGLFLSHAQFAKSLFSTRMQNDVNTLTNILRNEPSRFWTSVTVLGDVQMLDEDCLVQQLVNQAAHRGNSDDTYISGQVTFENIQVKNILLQSVNGINFNEIIKDAVIKNEVDQIILGRKQFIKLSAQAAASLENVQIPVVNKILLSVVNASIVDKNLINSIIIRGQKTFFDGMQADQIITTNISNIPIENFVSHLQNLQPAKLIASVKFDKLLIKKDLTIGKINNINFNDFLTNRLLLDGPPQTIASVPYINILNINGPSVVLSQINKIFMDDVVFDEDVLIESEKIFQNTVHCAKAFAESVNGNDVTQMYANSVFYDDPLINVTVLHFDSNAVLNGEAITAITVNNVDMDFIREMVDVSVLIKRSEIIQHNIDNIRETLRKNVPIKQKQATQYAYLEKATELQVNLPNSVDARVSVSKTDLLLHVEADELSTFCQLPSNCTCRNQHTVHISPSYSVGLFENKGHQRIFTYYNKDTSVNIVTKSVSSSSICRRENATEEFTTISWTLANDNKVQTSFVYPESIIGYVNDVSFFEINEVLYVFISRYYDVYKDTDEVDGIVMQFAQNKDQLHVIQYIPARKSLTAKVFQTSVGVILIMDSTPKLTVGTDIDGLVNIFKFNEQQERFELLRSILDGACSNSQVLNVDKESHFIVLTCRDSIKVFKYYQEFKNYYLFQVINEPYLISATVVQPEVYERTTPILFISRRDSFAVFRFRFLSGFSLFHEKAIQGIKALIPFTLNSKQFLFCPSLNSSIILKVITNG